MRIQACNLKIKSTGQKSTGWEPGLVVVKHFDIHADVNYFIRLSDGSKYDKVYDYHLLTGPCKHIDTEIF